MNFARVLLVPIVVVAVMMLAGMYRNEPALALIMPMDPVVMSAPMPGDPHPFITLIPISRTLGVIAAVAHTDREIDRHDA
jgi:hypothetical protein